MIHRRIRGQYWAFPRLVPVVAVSGDDSPCRPCGRLPGLPRWSTREPCLFDVRPCRPCLRSLAACFGPLTQIRDLLLPPCPPPPRRSTRARALCPVGRAKYLGCNGRTTLNPQPSSVQALRKTFSRGPQSTPAAGWKTLSAVQANNGATAVWIGGKKMGTIRNGRARTARPQPGDERGRRSGPPARARRRDRGLPTFRSWLLSLHE
jgi:hypothetical protein